MILESDIVQIMLDGGVLAAFTDEFGVEQPEIGQQILYFDEAEYEGRFVCVRAQGGSYSTSYYQRPSIAIYVAGLKTKSDAYVTKTIADRINVFFQTTKSSGGVTTLIPQSPSPAAMFTESGRPVYELFFDVIYKTT